MKRFVYTILFICVLNLNSFVQSQVPFHKGVNLSGWFKNVPNTGQIQVQLYNQTDFDHLKTLGCDVVRLPIKLFNFVGASPDYTVDPLFFELLDQVVTLAETNKVYLILDNHSDDSKASDNPDLQNILTKVWSQMAAHYKNRSGYIMYEVMNEPNGLTTAVWGAIQQAAINAIRSVDTQHFIVVGASHFNTYNELSQLPVYTDTKLIYTFHFYDPFIFTHQGATWPTTPVASLSGIPFPYNATTMPAVPGDVVGTSVETSMKSYSTDGTVAKIKSLIDIAVNFKTTRKANVYCGEFGVYNLNAPATDRVYWYNQVRLYLEAKGIPWTIWDYRGSFGLFNKGSNQLFDYDLNTPMLTALGLTVPPQKTYTLKPDSVGFMLYDDYIGTKTEESSGNGGGVINFYAQDKPNNGKYCISWTGSSQYGSVGFSFVPQKDLSYLKSKNYALSFLIRGTSSATGIDVRFVDTKTSDTDHPWRMKYSIDGTKVAFDGKWHKMFIPLTSFQEGGSSDGGIWYPAAGLFDWKAVSEFEVVAEKADLVGKNVWLDNIQISNMDTAVVRETSVWTAIQTPMYIHTALNLFLDKNRNMLKINCITDSEGKVLIDLLSLTGQKICNLVNQNQSLGGNTFYWKRDESIPKGMYLIRATIAGNMISKKILL